MRNRPQFGSWTSCFIWTITGAPAGSGYREGSVSPVRNPRALFSKPCQRTRPEALYLSTRLFAYGTLLPGLAPTAMRDVVERMRPIGAATVAGRLYDLGPYPGLVIGSDREGRVLGQLLDVPDDPELWLRMDAYEGFVPEDPPRSLFRRGRCRAQLAGNTGAGDCWVYGYNGDLTGAREGAGGHLRPPPGKDAH